ncbi:hypothetical protein P1X15_07325 [Runella sp. MFBS21]|uniref:hypothetical protein n=1 Tax=Runella sp. MFBS21 TaxID=3034018 RepID=UPI0023F83207|nr:hypothetical protein [Runella sp. MFBS21]MDF7817398.1 hypothetical protein [Runella sp. MFBS21]
MIKNQSIERTVEKLRRRFRELLSECGGAERLSKRLALIDHYFDSVSGYNDIRNAKREKAGEEAMIRIINAMEILAKSKTFETPSSRLNNSFKKMGIVEAYQPKFSTTQKLKEKFDQNKR